MTHPAEEIERASLSELHDVLTPEISESLGIQRLSIGSAMVSIAGNLPTSAIVLNRSIGLGLPGPESKESIIDIVEAYRQAGVARYFIHVHPNANPDNIPGWIGEAGLEKTRGWQKFARGTAPVEPSTSPLDVRKVDKKHASDVARIVCNAFDLGDAALPWIELLPNCPHWHVFMTFDGDNPAGVGAIYIDGDIAWTDFGATDLEFRRQGSQSALLSHRVQFALDQGCKKIFNCTGEEVPGDPQHSYSNILKTGFSEDYIRTNYAPPKVS